MKAKRPSEKKKKIYRRIVDEDPTLAPVMPLFMYQGEGLFKLEVLAFILNDVAPDSPNRVLAKMIERMVTKPPSKEDWIKQEDLAPIIGSTPYRPAPGSPLYALNKFLESNPCILRIEGHERASGNIEVRATHLSIPFPALFSETLGKIPGKSSDKVIEEWIRNTAGMDRILWLLWEILFQKIDLGRVKKCEVCGKWLVDHTKNKSKTRCSDRCTSRRWSWEERKKAGHGKGKKVQRKKKER